MLALFIVIQFVPAVQLDNPPVRREIAWDTPTTRDVARRACYDCHSNETVWPAYARVAPVSWLIAEDVREGREHLNFSEWDGPNEGLDEVVEVIESGEMPMKRYVALHPEAALTPSEVTRFINGLRRTFMADPPAEPAHDDEEHAGDDDDAVPPR